MQCDKNTFLKIGDVVTLYCDHWNGWLTSGDLVVGYGLWVPSLTQKMAVPPRVRETRMQLLPKFYYSSRRAYDKERTALDHQAGPDNKKLEYARQAVEIEDRQNQTEFERLMGEDLIYGQIIQLRHVSGNFVTVTKTMAKFEKVCLKVTMDKHGNEGSWFRIEPAFKFRAVGSRIPYGDSVRFSSVKFDQFLHVSPKNLPFRNLYIKGVHEVNASPDGTHFQVIPFSSTRASRNVQGGEAIGIYHSEINAFLLFDPVHPEKGPFWRHKKKKHSGARLNANALWIIEAEKTEFGGEDVLATQGVESNENPRQQCGYRLEHVCSGRYLALDASHIEQGITRLTMTEDFVGSSSLWHFCIKNEDKENEGECSGFQFDSDTPLYLQHATAGWMTHWIPDKKYRISNPLFADNRDFVAGLRKTMDMTDSMSLLQSDENCMADISQLMKLLKPLEFYITARKMSAPNLQAACTNCLCSAVGLEVSSKPAMATPGTQSSTAPDAGAHDSPTKGSSVSTDESWFKSPIKQRSDNLSSRSGDVRGSSSCEDVRMICAADVLFRDDFYEKFRDHIRYLRATKKTGPLITLLWRVAIVRALALIKQMETETSVLSKQLSEISDCLEGIKAWLCGKSLNGATVCTWRQKVIRDQGALLQLRGMLDWISNCGFSTNGGWSPKAEKDFANANMRAVVASLMFIKVGNLLYDILRLACTNFPENALFFKDQMSLFDLHLGTELRAALLMRQMFMNPSILNSLQQTDVHRYVMLAALYRKPTFVGMLRSLVRVGGLPVPLNQQRITQYFLEDQKQALPNIRVEKAGEYHVFVKKHNHEMHQDADDAWFDLEAYRDLEVEHVLPNCFDNKSLALMFFAECLSLFYDLCAGRNRLAVIKLGENPQLGLSYLEILGGMQSKMIPRQIRYRLGRLMIALYLDRDPQQSCPPIELEYVWSRVKEQPLTARPQIDPFAAMPAIQPTPGFCDLKAQVIHHLEHAISDDITEDSVSSALDVLSVHCQIATKLCEYGFFSPSIHSPPTIKDLQRLLELVCSNLNHGKLIQTGSRVAPQNTRALQFQLAELLSFGVSKRIELRRQFLLTSYDKIFEDASETHALEFEEALLVRLSHSVKEDPLFGGLKHTGFFSSTDGLRECLSKLAEADDNFDVQKLACKLLIQDACQDDELLEVLERLEILVSDDAVKYFNTLCACDEHIRIEGQSLVKGEKKGMETILTSVRTLVNLLDPEHHGQTRNKLVADLQKLMRFRSVHTHIIDILKVHYERVQVPGEMDEFKDGDLVPIINACFDFICRLTASSPDNQAELFPHIQLFMDYVNIKYLRAPEALGAIVENNAVLLNKLSDKVLRRICAAIARYGKYAKFLRFLKIVTCVHNKPIKRTQDLVMKLLQDEKELILELDGNKGTDDVQDGMQFDEDEILRLLSREGDETRFEMMLRKEYECEDSFLEYHVECLELLATCAQGSIFANKIKCQSFMPFEHVLEAILDLELLDRPAGDKRKHDVDALRYVRTALVHFLHSVYITMNDSRTQHEVSAEGNRVYGFGPTPHPKDRWRNRQSLIEHFSHEIELLVKRSRAEMSTQDTKRKYVSQVQKRLPESPFEFHYTYVVDAILPCLVDYYGSSKHYSFTVRAGNCNSEDCVVAAHRVAEAASNLLAADNLLNFHGIQVCMQLLETLQRCDVKVTLPQHPNKRVCSNMHSETDLQGETLSSLQQSRSQSFKASWAIFYRRVHSILQSEAGNNVGTRGMANFVALKPHEFISHICRLLVHLHACESGSGNTIRDDKLCLDWLQAIHGSLYISVSKASTLDKNWKLFLQDWPPEPVSNATMYRVGKRFLAAGALRMALTLLAHSNNHIVLCATRIVSQVLLACPQEAQDEVKTILKEKGLDTAFLCVQGHLRQFAEDAKCRENEATRRHEASRAGSKAQTEGINPAAGAPFAAGACEMLQMFERLCKRDTHLQHVLRRHNVLAVIVNFLEETEASITTALMSDDSVTILMMVKGFHVLSAATGGPNNMNRLFLTRTNVLGIMNRLLGKLRYSTEDEDLVQEAHKAMLRVTVMEFLVDLVCTPMDPLVAKRIVDTIDWHHMLHSWPQVNTVLEQTMLPLCMSKEALLLGQKPRVPRDVAHVLDDFFKQRLARDGLLFPPSASITTIENNPGSAASQQSEGNTDCELERRTEMIGTLFNMALKLVVPADKGKDDESFAAMSRRALAENMARECLLLATTLAILLGEDVFAHFPNLKSRQETITTILDDIEDTVSFYMQRITSVEIVRKHVLQRLYFCLPESAMSIQEKTRSLDQLDEMLYHELPTDSERERQEALLERFEACASNLRCEAELSVSSSNWVLIHKSSLENMPTWIVVALNFIFILLFEEHGTAAEICLPSGRWIDWGHLGLPFFASATWLLLALGVVHLFASLLRFYASVLERYPYHVFHERRAAMLERNKQENAGIEVTMLDSAAIHAAALHATLSDVSVLFNGVLLVSSVFGMFWSPFWYAIPLVDLLRTPTVLTLISSVQHNADKLGQGALVGALLVYAHSILGYAIFRHHHQEGKCDNLFECTMNYLIGGMKGDSIDSLLQDLDIPGAIWEDGSMWARIMLDMSFYMIIPLVLLSIISGIIIDGFGELRDEQSEAKQYRESTSVVCGVSRITMEQFSPGSFDRHVERGQNPHHYIFLLLYLELQDLRLDSAQQAFVRAQVHAKHIDFLPKGTAMCLCNKDHDKEEQGDVAVSTMELLKSMNVRLRSMEKDIRWMQAQQNMAVRPLDDAEKALMDAEKQDWFMNMGGLPSLSMPSMNALGEFPKLDLGMPTLDIPTLKMPEISMPKMPELPDMSKMDSFVPKIPEMPSGDPQKDCKQQ